MPQAVTHILVPILLVAIFRDFYLKRRNKKSFPLHYVFIAGLGGVLPDIDFIISAIINFTSPEVWSLHKTLTHSLMFPIALFILFILLKPVSLKAKICNLGRHNLRLSTIFLMLSIGALIHLGLDFITGEWSYLLYPFSSAEYGLNLITYLSQEWQGVLLTLIDGILLVIYLAYLEFKHKISDFI